MAIAAIDKAQAAIAANAFLGLADPAMNGIGGDLFAVVWDAKTNKLYGLNASGRSPYKATPDFFAQKKLDDMKQTLRDMAAFRQSKKEEYAEKMRAGDLNINGIQANDRHIEKLKQEEQAYQVEIQRQAERVNEAQSEADDAMEAMLKATQEFKALEKHKEKWIKQVKREVTLKEEDAADEIAQAQYFKRMADERED